MSTVLTSLTLVVTSVMGIAGDCVDFVVATPLLLIPFAFTLVGGAIGLFKKLK